ncbi:MAG: NADH:flavin oxidoreductase, partial [Chloroflexales bacterium]|nr:NADH:flavin oxidoreductase [Chloroflexales bacterium]
GYRVALAEREREPGGRVAREARLPGLSAWRRVVDWRLTQIGKLPTVTLYPGNQLSAPEILEVGYEHIIVATGADWRRDGVGRTLHRPIPGHAQAAVFTPDDLMAGMLPAGRVVVYDDDHYYMGGVLAELLAGQGRAVTLVTAAPMASYWSQFTLEQERIQRRLAELHVALCTRATLGAIGPGVVTLVSTITGRVSEAPCDAVVLVTDRLPRGTLAADLAPAREAGRVRTLRVIGDADAPNIIAQAVFAGHLAAQAFDEPSGDGPPFRVER